jgi:reversibly glycosylated polypeptide/UDP-arabinopyranose mutase
MGRESMKTVLVVPTCRPESFAAFRDAWNEFGDWDEMVVVEDAPERITAPDNNPHHYHWGDIERVLGDDAWIISRRDSAIRSFGYLMAYRMGADLIVTLDDDCHPHGVFPLCGGHQAAMSSHSRWISSVPGMRVRGLPYRNSGDLSGAMVNVGLWSGVPDLDALTTLAGTHPAEGFEPPPGNRIIPRNQYTAMCGMNLAFRREVAPLMYFPLMGEGQIYQRFDDIWSGVICKHILDHMGLSMSVGEPFVRHCRASNPFVNLAKESRGIGFNEYFWETIDRAVFASDTPVGCMLEMGEHLLRNADPYLAKLGAAITVWAGLFA